MLAYLLATVTGLAVAMPTLRLRGLYLALATVAFAQAALWVFTRWNSVTYGGAGFRVPPLDFEPSHGLSPLMVRQMVVATRRLHERGMTILLVEQNVGVAAAVSKLAYVLVNGEIEFSTPGAELADNPDVLRSYLGGGGRY